MKSRTAGILTGALALGAVFAWPRLTLSPGRLSQGHASIENRCFECHDLGGGTPRDKCVACHALERIGVRDAAGSATAPAIGMSAARTAAIVGMHLSFVNVPCGECHTDHAGRAPSSATPAFSHEALASGVRSRCAACHETLRPADDLHRAASGECGVCHASTAWKPATFEHEMYFVLDRKHTTACQTCHDQPGDFRAYTCYGCHEHSPARMASKHREEGVRDLDNCVRCHRSGSEHEGGGERGGEGEDRQRRRGESHEEDDD